MQIAMMMKMKVIKVAQRNSKKGLEAGKVGNGIVRETYRRQ